MLPTNGHLDLAQFLIGQGADVSGKSKNASTLHLASSGGHVNLARFLLKHGADVSAKSKDESTPLSP